MQKTHSSSVNGSSSLPSSSPALDSRDYFLFAKQRRNGLARDAEEDGVGGGGATLALGSQILISRMVGGMRDEDKEERPLFAWTEALTKGKLGNFGRQCTNRKPLRLVGGGSHCNPSLRGPGLSGYSGSV